MATIASPSDASDAASAPALTVAGVAALLASGCCVVPLVLALVGVSGAWIGQLRRIEPYSPFLIGLSAVALGVAGWRLFGKPVASCTPEHAGCRRRNSVARRWFWVVAFLALVPSAAPFVAPWFY